jgi:hypothetical protein
MDGKMAIERYCQAWNELDKEKRLAILKEIATLNVRYIDPTVEISGLEALNAHIDVILSRYPNSIIVRTTEIDRHHDVARFGWKKVLSDGSSFADSIDLVEFDSNQAISRIVGFFGPLQGLSS